MEKGSSFILLAELMKEIGKMILEVGMALKNTRIKIRI
jgi:hypothetical protein